jgi:2-phosphosulfolactate phosphatase
MRERYVHVHELPRHVAEAELAGSAVVVIDLLRASTTICQALASGAREVVPFLEVEDALAAAANEERGQIVLGGERQGKKIAGFDLGNSPAEYTPDVVRGRRVLITTTNGTRALYHAQHACRVLIGALVNLSALVASVKSEARVEILCAGTGDDETREDILAAGAIVSRLLENGDSSWSMSDAAGAAREEWHTVCAAAEAAGRPLREQLALELRDTAGGRNLLGIGLDQDLVDCAQIDRLLVVPELDVRAWRITA